MGGSGFLLNVSPETKTIRQTARVVEPDAVTEPYFPTEICADVGGVFASSNEAAMILARFRLFSRISVLLPSRAERISLYPSRRTISWAFVQAQCSMDWTFNVMWFPMPNHSAHGGTPKRARTRLHKNLQ